MTKRTEYLKNTMRLSGHHRHVFFFILAACIAADFVNGLSIDLPMKGVLDPPDPVDPPPPTSSVEGRYKKAAISTRSEQCAEIGRYILDLRGSVVDSAIATHICEGVLSPQSMGIGGGFMMTLYTRKDKTAISLIARETAPAAATEDMFHGNATLSQNGGLAAAVPGEIRGFATAHRLFGNLAWPELVQPTIDLIVDGVPVTQYMENVLQYKKDDIRETPSLRELFVNPATGDVWQTGDRYPNPALLRTLRILRDDGPESFYNGSIGMDLARDIQEDFGGIITFDDINSYTDRLEDPVVFDLPGGLRLYTPPPPGSGVLLGFILSVMSGFPPGADETTTMLRLAETFKFAYAKRTHLGDAHFYNVTEVMNNLTSADYAAEIRNAIWDNQTFNDPEHYGAELYQPDNHGTLHTSILAPNGDAVAITDTVNRNFGANIRSRSTGIILNDEMDDFSAPNITNGYNIPPSPANFIVPGKMPLSSMCPAIIVDQNGDVRMITGSAGGSRITTATATVALRYLYNNQTIKESTDARRIHHQLLPMEISYEYETTAGLVSGLSGKGHVMTRSDTSGSHVNSVVQSGGVISANGDFRGLNVVAGTD